MLRNWASAVYRSLLVRISLNVNALSVEKRIYRVCQRGLPQVLRVDTATAQEPFERGQSTASVTLTRHDDSPYFCHRVRSCHTITLWSRP